MIALATALPVQPVTPPTHTLIGTVNIPMAFAKFLWFGRLQLDE
jgi:hypothetical protein